MALFQKREISNNLPLYTLDSTKTVLIVGLGNPGEKYKNTRHNIGFEIVGGFAKKENFPDWSEKKSLQAEISVLTQAGKKLICAKPTTYMNESGRAVKSIQIYFKIDNKNTLVVADELDVDFGKIKSRYAGGAAGHKGVESIIKNCGDNFNRVRVGIGPKKPRQIDSSKFVLAKFTDLQVEALPKITNECIGIISEFVATNSPLKTDTRSLSL